eukprot:g71650.t1
MAEVDYIALDEKLSHQWTAGRSLKALTGLLSLSLLGLSGWTCWQHTRGHGHASHDDHDHASHDGHASLNKPWLWFTGHKQLGLFDTPSEDRFTPREGVDAVLVRPGPAGALEALLPPSIAKENINCIFSYGSLSKNKPFTKGAKASQDGRLYGVLLPIKTDLAQATGKAEDTLDGRLLCFSPLDLKARLELADTHYNYPQGGLVNRVVVAVALEDGFYRRAYCHLASPVAPVTSAIGPPSQVKQATQAAYLYDPPRDIEKLLKGLNTEQLAAVTLPNENSLIIAGAGTGKTRVLTTRIAYILQKDMAMPYQVLAVTFTNKAAREMEERLANMMGGKHNLNGMWIGTFHGLCNRLLRRHAKAARLSPNYTILDTQDQARLIKEMVKKIWTSEEKTDDLAKEVQQYISSRKEEGIRPGDIPRTFINRQKLDLYDAYEKLCAQQGVVDFGELLLRSYELLRDSPAVRSYYQHRFRYILVDEFQDTNLLQYKWLGLLAGHGEVLPHMPGSGPAQLQSKQRVAVMAVGDDDQSIYAFRGANVGNMMAFLLDYQVQYQIKLESNYRSFGNILNSANKLIERNSQRIGKNLRTSRGAGEPVVLFQASEDFYRRTRAEEVEANFVIEKARSFISQGVPLKEIAFLYRCNFQSRIIELGLFKAGIPYRVYGGLRFYERKEVKDAIAYLRLISNPDDDPAFQRVVNMPKRGIGDKTVQNLKVAAEASNCSLAQAARTSSGAPGKKLRDFVLLIDTLRKETFGCSLEETIRIILGTSGLYAEYKKEEENEKDKDKSSGSRLENLQQLVLAGKIFEESFPTIQVADAPQGLDVDGIVEEEGMSVLQAFLSSAALEPGDDGQSGDKVVQLMTIHASKGLEFDVVFITGLEQGLFPHERSLGSDSDLEEERRLLYVALTRARKHLHLCYADKRFVMGQYKENPPSQFLDELPEDTLERIDWKKVSKLSARRLRDPNVIDVIPIQRKQPPQQLSPSRTQQLPPNNPSRSQQRPLNDPSRTSRPNHNPNTNPDAGYFLPRPQ